MKFLLLLFSVLAVLYFHSCTGASIAKDSVPVELAAADTRVSWWRTLPIRTTITVAPRPRPPPRTTTSPNRISASASIAVPTVLFAMTIILGFGFIGYAALSGGNGIPCLTRTV